jgi:hypothetical protein
VARAEATAVAERARGTTDRATAGSGEGGRLGRMWHIGCPAIESHHVVGVSSGRVHAFVEERLDRGEPRYITGRTIEDRQTL